MGAGAGAGDGSACLEARIKQEKRMSGFDAEPVKKTTDSARKTVQGGLDLEREQ